MKLAQLALLCVSVLIFGTGCDDFIDGVCITPDGCNYGMTEKVCKAVYPVHIRFEALPVTSVIQGHTERRDATEQLCRDNGYTQCHSPSSTCTQ